MSTIVEIIPETISVIENTDTTVTTTQFVIKIRDSLTGEPVSANGMPVKYRVLIDGVQGEPITKYVIGDSAVINKSTSSIVRRSDGQLLQSYWIILEPSNYDIPDEPPASSIGCDLNITSVRTDRKESAPGAADAQITIIATSSHLPIRYSLDGVTYQNSPTFSGLTGGPYFAYVIDANDCTKVYDLTIETIKGLLISDPSVYIGGGNLSYWNAAFNPIVFTYQRKDFAVTGITADGNGKTIVSVNANVTGPPAKEKVYLKAGAYNGVYEITNASGNQLFIDVPFASSGGNTGFININRYRPYYQILTEVSYFDRDSGTTKTVTSTNRPDQTGLVRADISSFLQSLVRAKDESLYNQINFQDTNLSASYTVRYAEEWDGQAPAYVNIEHPYYVVYAAKQLGDAYGGNLAAYVPFPSVNSANKLAAWITDFAEPAYSISYPFDIGFIYGDALAGHDIYYEMTLLDINRQPITGSAQTSFLLNEDSSFLLNQDGTKLVITDASVSNAGIAEHIGLNRLLINQSFPPDAYYFTLTLKYDENDISYTITKTQTVRIDDMVDDNSIYLRWIGLTGSWNYYRFVYNQEISLDVQNAVIIKNFVSDWANQDGIEDVISKSAGQKMKVMAEDLSINDIKGLQSIKYSPKVQMLVSKDPIKWQTVVLNTATFAEYETRNGQAPFSVTFNLPGINIQTQ